MIKKISLLSYCLLVFLTTFCVSAQAQETPSAYAYITEYTFAEEQVDRAIELLTDYQRQTLDADEGCLVLDLLWSENNSSLVFVYANFESEDIYKKHTQTPHYKTLMQHLKPLIASEKTTKVIPLNQDEDIFEEDF